MSNHKSTLEIHQNSYSRDYHHSPSKKLGPIRRELDADNDGQAGRNTRGDACIESPTPRAALDHHVTSLLRNTEGMLTSVDGTKRLLTKPTQMI